MALTKTISQTMQNQNNAAAPVAVTQTVEAIVSDGVLVVSFKDLNPGVFTAGTPREGTSTNPQP